MSAITFGVSGGMWLKPGQRFNSERQQIRTAQMQIDGYREQGALLQAAFGEEVPNRRRSAQASGVANCSCMRIDFFGCAWQGVSPIDATAQNASPRAVIEMRAVIGKQVLGKREGLNCRRN